MPFAHPTAHTYQSRGSLGGEASSVRLLPVRVDCRPSMLAIHPSGGTTSQDWTPEAHLLRGLATQIDQIATPKSRSDSGRRAWEGAQG